MTSMFQQLTKQWYTLRAGMPGMRFRRVYENRCRERGLLCHAWRNRIVAAAIVLGLAGLAAMSLLSVWGASIIAISVMLIGRESLRVAEWLDAADASWHRWQQSRRQLRG
jgi:hypothetical protein